MPPLYRSGNDLFIPWRQPIRAPHSITYHLLHEFKKFGKVKYYSLYEHRVIDLKPDDILIGLPSQDHGDMPWKKPDDASVMAQTMKKYPDHKQAYIIMPYSNDPLFVGWANEFVMNHGKNLLLLSGKIWFNNWEDSPWKNFPIQQKVRVDMGIEPIDYPAVKKTFNSKGRRGFLYVGHTSWYKNTPQLAKIAAAMPEFRFGHVGLGTIPGWDQISDFADLNAEFMEKICKTYDCFVNVSWDAQVTTVLEQMCFGLTVACTPESGYECPYLLPLDIHDTDHNTKILREFQQTDEQKLLEIGRLNRQYAIDHHSWKQFTDTVVQFIGLK